jgi:long-chain acyl-CoA synthetase
MSTPKTLTEQFKRWATERANEPAIHGKDSSGAWKSYTWGEYWTASREVAKGLIALGHEPKQCVAIVGANRPEWVICQFGIALAGGIPAPSYATNTLEQVGHIVENSEASIAIADSKLLLDRWRQAAEARGRTLTKVVAMLDGLDDEAMTLNALRALGREQDDAELDARIDATDENDVCLLIYTSGTTGVAKGVMLSQGNIVAMGDSLMQHIPIFDHPDTFRSVSYLPLCHVAEQLLTNFMQMATGGQVYFCPDLSEVKDYLAEVHPTNFAAVPRVWEKFQAALEAKLAAATGIKAKLATWARKTESAAIHEEIRTGREVNTFSQVRRHRGSTHLGGHSGVLCLTRYPCARGVWHERDLGGRHRQPPRAASLRHGGHGAFRLRGGDRQRRRDYLSRREYDRWLPAHAGQVRRAHR